MLGISCHTEQPSYDLVRANFMNHLETYGISYGTKEEFEFRFQVYLQKDKEINELNGEDTTFVVAHNKFSTLTEEEMKKYRGKKPVISDDAPVVELDVTKVASEVDWRKKGAVNPIQDQGNCGSCWAFSSVAAMEGSHFIEKGELLKLSEQQLVDCSKKQGNEGCDGGLEVYAFKYAEKASMELEKDYPYHAKTKKCKAVESKEEVGVKTYARVPKDSVS